MAVAISASAISAAFVRGRGAGDEVDVTFLAPAPMPAPVSAPEIALRAAPPPPLPLPPPPLCLLPAPAFLARCGAASSSSFNTAFSVSARPRFFSPVRFFPDDKLAWSRGGASSLSPLTSAAPALIAARADTAAVREERGRSDIYDISERREEVEKKGGDERTDFFNAVTVASPEFLSLREFFNLSSCRPSNHQMIKEQSGRTAEFPSQGSPKAGKDEGLKAGKRGRSDEMRKKERVDGTR